MTSPIPETKQPLTQGVYKYPCRQAPCSGRAIPVLTHDPQGSSSTWENAQTDKPSLLSPGCAVLPVPAGLLAPGLHNSLHSHGHSHTRCQWPAWPDKPRWNVGVTGVTAPSPFSAVHWQCWCIPTFANSTGNQRTSSNSVAGWDSSRDKIKYNILHYLEHAACGGLVRGAPVLYKAGKTPWKDTEALCRPGGAAAGMEHGQAVGRHGQEHQMSSRRKHNSQHHQPLLVLITACSGISSNAIRENHEPRHRSPSAHGLMQGWDVLMP